METIWDSVYSLNYKGRDHMENEERQRDFKSLRKWWKFGIIVGMRKMGNDQKFAWDDTHPNIKCWFQWCVQAVSKVDLGIKWFHNHDLDSEFLAIFI